MGHCNINLLQKLFQGFTKCALKQIIIFNFANFFKVLNLNEGLSYYFRVKAQNEYGMGPACEMSSAIKASEVPYPPTSLQTLATTAQSVTLQWDKPYSDCGSKITGILKYSKRCKKSWYIISYVAFNTGKYF